MFEAIKSIFSGKSKQKLDTEKFLEALNQRNPIACEAAYYLSCISLMMLASCSDGDLQEEEIESVQAWVTTFEGKLEESANSYDYKDEGLLDFCKLFITSYFRSLAIKIDSEYNSSYQSYFDNESDTILQLLMESCMIYGYAKYGESDQADMHIYQHARNYYIMVAYIISSDKKIEDSEMKFLLKLEKILSLPKEETDSIKEKYISSYLDEDEMLLAADKSKFDITDELSNSDIRSILNREFLRWNQRLDMANSDEDKQIANDNIDSIIRLKRALA